MEESMSSNLEAGIDLKSKVNTGFESKIGISLKPEECMSLKPEVSRSIKPEGSLLSDIRVVFPGKKQDVRAYSPLTLAYIGDAVYDLIIRTVVVERANRPANELHHITVRYVSAEAQSRIVETLMESFTEEELSVYRRGRNSKPHTMAKNASPANSLKATGFEAGLGYLYLQDRMERVLELVKKGMEVLE